MARKRKIRLNLALQGGGAHGAFTWGALDRILEVREIELGTISATSAGAVNAVALASGLATGGREAARDNLRQLWVGVEKARVPDLIKFNPFFYGLSKSPTLARMASMMSPYDFNPMGFDPLRALLNDVIDFETIREKSVVGLLIAATDVATGRARLFCEKEMIVEMVLASACLPTVHHAVEIDGHAYWDGGFSSNPDIVNLAEESSSGDTLIVQLNPRVKSSVPKGAREIADHINTLTFNAPLQRDVETIIRMRRASRSGWFGWRRRCPVADHRFHLIEAGRHTAALKPSSKVNPEWEILNQLFRAGRLETNKWLDRHLSDVGRRETVDLGRIFLTPDRDAMPELSPTDEAPHLDGEVMMDKVVSIAAKG
ncbi:MAG: patatin-like phospholipase family protein [Hyphomicrobiaceae bacterium]